MVARFLSICLWLVCSAGGALLCSAGGVLLCSAGGALLCSAGGAWAAAGNFDADSGLPPVVEDTTKAAPCTIAYLVNDITTGDLIAARMQIDADPNAKAANNLMPCPSNISPQVPMRALEVCKARAGDPKSCVFADMSREFVNRPGITTSAENSSRCRSDLQSHLGVACLRAGGLQVCGVGCGASAEAAIAAASLRCETKQQKPCPITGSLPVLAPR